MIHLKLNVPMSNLLGQKSTASVESVGQASERESFQQQFSHSLEPGEMEATGKSASRPANDIPRTPGATETPSISRQQEADASAVNASGQNISHGQLAKTATVYQRTVSDRPGNGSVATKTTGAKQSRLEPRSVEANNQPQASLSYAGPSLLATTAPNNGCIQAPDERLIKDSQQRRDVTPAKSSSSSGLRGPGKVVATRGGETATPPASSGLEVKQAVEARSTSFLSETETERPSGLFMQSTQNSHLNETTFVQLPSSTKNTHSQDLPGLMRESHTLPQGLQLQAGREASNIQSIKTLQSIPNGVEVGVRDGANGWLRVHARMSQGGEIAASLLTTTAGHAAHLQVELPHLSEYLIGEGLGISSLEVSSVKTTSDRDGAPSTFGEAEPGNRQADQGGGKRKESTSTFTLDMPDGSGLRGHDARDSNSFVSPQLSNSGGAWLSVLA